MDIELIPMREKTMSLVRELLGPEATDRQVHYCTISIVSMFFHPMVMQRTAVRSGNSDHPVIIDDVRTFADHVVAFALAGIRDIRYRESRS
jgi:hypothetical protein